MVDMQAVDEHLVLRADHVVVGVAGELHAEAVGRLAGFAVADVVGEDDEVFGDVEWWPGPNRTSEKTGFNSEWALPPVPCRSNGVIDVAAGCRGGASRA